ncbi:uncharacterized protein LTR77_005978 [Saxophila tyrrhenica]|uniref:Uncharacterized protein n=1 Tax=Saxophila tyrrhenica TaxID=1690608 RepID=A0AAV9PA36_9PEZI|nr:hypothetical protein LTR77_005978 [Saxophila tyrrhenica]
MGMSGVDCDTGIRADVRVAALPKINCYNLLHLNLKQHHISKQTIYDCEILGYLSTWTTFLQLQESDTVNNHINDTITPIKPQIRTMTSTMPLPTSQTQLPRNDSFSTDDITKAFKASDTKARNHLSLKIVKQDETTVPPPSPHESRPASAYGHREVRR